MRSQVSTLAGIALLSLATANVSVSAEILPTQPLWQFQWALENNETSQGVCTTVPWDGTCQHDAVLPLADMDINANSVWAGPATASAATASQRVTPPILIGMIDTGIDYQHPDLRHHVWNNPGELLGSDNNANGVDDGCEDGVDNDQNGYIDDCHGINALVPASLSPGVLNPVAGDPMDSALAHGTHMAGLMIGDTGNGYGIRGVAGNANVQIVTCKAAQQEPVLELVPGTVVPALTQARMKQCVDYFIALKQRGENLAVINTSGGMSAYINLGLMWAKVKKDYLLDPEIFLPLLAKLHEMDVLVVAAAGNMTWDMDTRFDERAYFPAAFSADNVLSVTALDAQGNLWSNSSYGRYSVDVGAPGHQILSSLPPNASNTAEANYGITSGTSPATALVSGLAALLRASPETANLSAPQLRRLIMASGRPLASLADKTVSGRSIRVYDSNGSGAFSCNNQWIQRRVTPRTNQMTLLPGDTLHLEVESFNCANISALPIVLTSPQGVTLTLGDDGMNGDRVAGDGVFSADWIIPDAPAFRYQWTLNQGTAMPAETISVTTAIVADNGDATADSTGTWWPSKLRAGYWENGYAIAYTSSSERAFSWKPLLPRSGRYEVQVRWPEYSGFASNALFHFTDSSGTENSFRLNQKINGGHWVSLGEYNFNQGDAGFTLSNAGADNTVAADAIQLIWKGY